MCSEKGMGTVDFSQRSPLSFCDLVNQGVERRIPSLAAKGIRAVSVDGDLRSRLALFETCEDEVRWEELTSRGSLEGVIGFFVCECFAIEGYDKVGEGRCGGGIWVRVGEIWVWVKGGCGGVGGLVRVEGWAGLGVGLILWTVEVSCVDGVEILRW